MGNFIQESPYGDLNYGVFRLHHVDSVGILGQGGCNPISCVDPLGLATQYSVGLGGAFALFTGGASGAINLGISIPDNPSAVGSYQLFLNAQVNGTMGAGLYLGWGAQFNKSTSDCPLPVASVSQDDYAELDVLSNGLSWQGNFAKRKTGGIGGALPIRIGEGLGYYAGVGGTGSVTIATPVFGH